jgi:hypothetical protein
VTESPNSPLAAPDLAGALQKFEARLAERTRIPASKLSEFMGWPDERLRRESKAVSRILRRFAEAVVDSMEDPDTAHKFLEELDLKGISRDHDWRAIFSTIRAQEKGYEGYKRAVLVKYLQYLSFRKRLVEYVVAKRRGLEETDEYSDITLFALRYSAEIEGGAPTGYAHRAIDPDYVRLPLGESVDFELLHGSAVKLMLASHVFALSGQRPPLLTDQNGASHALREGRNMVGRHPEGDVVVDANFTDVSRAHVIMEWDGTRRIRLIDFSSRGTFVHRSAVSRPSEDPTTPRS